MNEKEYSEYLEGYRAFKPDHKPKARNPYPWTNQELWRHELWDKGSKAAQQDYEKAAQQRRDDDDDDYGGKGPAGWPSGTGNPSGGGRQNA